MRYLKAYYGSLSFFKLQTAASKILISRGITFMLSNCNRRPSPASSESFASDQMATQKHSQEWTTRPAQPCKMWPLATFQLMPLWKMNQKLQEIDGLELHHYFNIPSNSIWLVFHGAALKPFCPLSEDKVEFTSEILSYQRLPALVLKTLNESSSLHILALLCEDLTISHFKKEHHYLLTTNTNCILPFQGDLHTSGIQLKAHRSVKKLRTVS